MCVVSCNEYKGSKHTCAGIGVTQTRKTSRVQLFAPITMNKTILLVAVFLRILYYTSMLHCDCVSIVLTV